MPKYIYIMKIMYEEFGGSRFKFQSCDWMFGMYLEVFRKFGK